MHASERRRVLAAVEILKEMGPATPRPVVDQISGSVHANMKELRTGTIRVLFAFDPQRTAILQLGGNKRGQWNKWYAQMVPRADQLLTEHLATIHMKEDDDDSSEF
ncbi:MAG: diaminopimelate decarboxylase [Chloroflexi bacterium]|nr:MAG: diaminopimelate decarboxylase [Chloroflexota bacterium]